MPQLEALSESQITFKPQSEVVGWTQAYGSSRPITGVVVGRELRGADASSGTLKFSVETYVKITGNKHPLLMIPNSRLHQGLTGEEVVITESLSPEFALRLDHSIWPADISELPAIQMVKGEEAALAA